MRGSNRYGGPALPLPAYDAVVLTGGAARRLGGAYKPAIEVGGRPLAASVGAAVAGAQCVVVVGPPAPGVAADVVTRESPAGGGPAAALEAGLAHVTAPVVVALAADMPFLTADVVDELRLALAFEPAAAAAVLVDDTGRDQPLCSVWRTELLRDALAEVADPIGEGTDPGLAELAAAAAAAGMSPAGDGPEMTRGDAPGRLGRSEQLVTPRLYGVALRDLLAAAEPLARRTVVVDGGPPPWFDCDTEDDVTRAREWT
jgi:molybdopterin-guanine dinucleotide biosynthesis protein A